MVPTFASPQLCFHAKPGFPDEGLWMSFRVTEPLELKALSCVNAQMVMFIAGQQIKQPGLGGWGAD